VGYVQTPENPVVLHKYGQALTADAALQTPRQSTPLREGRRVMVHLNLNVPMFQSTPLAGVTFKDARGRRLDYHAFSHTFSTNLDRSGCSRATKKKLMRHANEDVTDGYGHAELAEMVAALQHLDSPLNGWNRQQRQAVMIASGGAAIPTGATTGATKTCAFRCTSRHLRTQGGRRLCDRASTAYPLSIKELTLWSAACHTLT
jgi:hypothetical protein